MIFSKKIRTQGFTLLETLLAIGILAVLTAALVNYLQKEQEKNIISIASTQVNMILNAAAQYQTTYVTWPNSLSALIPFNNAISLSSPWRNSTGINDYTLTSAPTSHYFSIQVAVPSTTVAQQLISAIPNGYFSVNGNQVLVTAYTTAFIKPDYPPHPTGILYGSMSLPTTPNPTPTPSGISSDDSYAKVAYLTFPSPSNTLSPPAQQPLGLIDAVSLANENAGVKPKKQRPVGVTTFTQVYQPAPSYPDAPISTQLTSGTESPACPNGSTATFIFLPVAVRQDKPKGAVSWAKTAGFASVYTHLVALGSGKIAACINAGFPYYNESGGASKQMKTDLGFISDIVCLPNDAISLNRWPDMTFSGTYCPPYANGGS